MFRSLLIANRGEIARRIGAVARSMGLRTIAVYSDADAQAPFVKEADQAVRLGPPPPKDSYLNVEALIGAAKETGAEAVHPGYGFVSENAEFARACTEAGIVFVGPPPESMARMKDKAQARALAAGAGVPVVPGSDGVVADLGGAGAAAERIGFPVLVKAAGGGGGIGMAVAGSQAELEKAFRACADRARSAFGRDAVYLERYFPAPRHIEVQILGDTHGNLLHVLERECSIQRRHQKVVEEAGSPLFLDGKNPELLRKMSDAALAAARAFGMVTPYYDPLLAKLIVSGKSRDEAIRRSEGALQRFEIKGLKNNVPLHLRIVRDRAFQEGVLDTHFLEHHAKP